MLRRNKNRVTLALPEWMIDAHPTTNKAPRDKALSDKALGDKPSRDKPLRDKPLRDKPWIFRTYAGHSDRHGVERALPQESEQGADRAFGRLRSADADRLRQRPSARQGRGRQGRRADLASRRHARPVRRHPARRDEHVDDHQRHRRLAARRSMSRSPTSKACRAQSCTGTTQNDIIKEYLSRGTYVFPPAPSMRLTKDVILFTTKEMPKWNPMNVCSYHLQEAGATPVQELAFALATAIGVLDAVKASGECARGGIRRGGRPHLVLRQCRAALRHRNLQDARLHRAVGRDHARALRRDRCRSSGCSATACRSIRWG